MKKLSLNNSSDKPLSRNHPFQSQNYSNFNTVGVKPSIEGIKISINSKAAPELSKSKFSTLSQESLKDRSKFIHRYQNMTP